MTWLATVKAWARRVRSDVIALWIAARDPRTPLAAKVVAAAVSAYALSPIDLIPDFVPVLGYLDDLLVVPLGILLAVKLIPTPLMLEFRTSAVESRTHPVSKIGFISILIVWLFSGVGVVWLVWPHVAG